MKNPPGIMVTHVDFSEATEEEKTVSINRTSSALATIISMINYAKQIGVHEIPIDLIAHVVHTCVSGQDSDFEEALAKAIKAAEEGDMTIFEEIDGKRNLPDNVTEFVPKNKTVH